MSRSKYRLGDKVMITKSALYPESSWLMGTITKINGDDGLFTYDINFGISGIKNEKNVHEEDLKFYE